MHDVAIQRRRQAIFREERNPPGLLAGLVKRLDGLTLGRPLRVVDLPEIQHMTLHRASTTDAAVFDYAPVTVRLAVLVASLMAQKHAAKVSIRARSRKRLGRHRSPVSPIDRQHPALPAPLRATTGGEISANRGELRKPG
jgi:hypothetical protein